jgi:hypothetical protein
MPFSECLAVRTKDPQDVQPVHIGHVQVEDDHLHLMDRQRFDGLQPRGGFDEADVGQAPQRCAHHLSNCR